MSGDVELKDFEINITSYRFPEYVNQLVAKIRLQYPSAFIRVWDNSPAYYPYRDVQDIRWNRFNPSLSRVWNWAILQSTTDRVLICNDDIDLQDDWLREIRREVAENPGVLWHGPSRFFLYHRSLVDLVGFFDERFTGFTYEDLDYVRRMNELRLPIHYGTHSTLHVNARSRKGEIDRPCFPATNREHLEAKYLNSNMEVFEDRPRFETPDFYPCRPK